MRPLTRCLLRDPTLRGFAGRGQDARAGRLARGRRPAEIDFAREADARRSRIRRDGARSRPRPDWRSPREVLLTGATGFLGAHLLRELLAATGARVWCLVRARDAAHARQRIAEAAARYELPAPPPTAWCRCPATSPSPGSACPPANSASSPAASTSSTTRARW